MANSSKTLANRARRRLKIQQNTPVGKNTSGQPVENWVAVITTTPDECLWAEVEDLSGREFFNAVQVQADVDTRIRIRNYDGATITPDMRGVIGSVVYHFRSVRWADVAQSTLEIMAVKTLTNPVE